jgi:hypothetical protein
VHGYRLRPVVDREPGARGVAEGADAVVPRVKWSVLVVGAPKKNAPRRKKCVRADRKEKKEKKRKEKKQKNGLEWRQDEEQKEETDAAIEERSEERA